MKKAILGVLAAAVLFAVEAQAQNQYAPRNFRAVVVDETNVRITWDHPDASYVSIDYDFYAEPFGQGERDDGSGAVTSHTFQGLTPGTDYRVWIQAHPRIRNADGVIVDGRGGSVMTTITTGGTRPYPPDAPDPTCTLADGTLTVSWEAVRYATGYRSYIRSGARGTTATEFGGDNTAARTRTYPGSSLQPGTTYAVDVRAESSAGNSLWGLCSFRTPASTDPETPTDPGPPIAGNAQYAPRNLSAVAVDETGVNVTWDHPTASYASIEYDISAEPVGSGVSRNVSSSNTSYNFRGLTPRTVYTIRVVSNPRVTNENGGTSPATGATATTTVTTGGDSPSPPTDPEPENRVCRYEHRLNTVPGTTAASHNEWIRLTSRVADANVSIRAYHFEDGRSLDVLDAEDEVVGFITTLGAANSIKRFRVEGVSGWHTVVVAHGITTTDGMNGVTVSMVVRGPEGRQIVPADVVEHCTTTTTTTQVN